MLVCEICNRRFKSEQALGGHMSRAHPQKPGTPPAEGQLKRALSLLCHQLPKLSYLLQHHQLKLKSRARLTRYVITGGRALPSSNLLLSLALSHPQCGR